MTISVPIHVSNSQPRMTHLIARAFADFRAGFQQRELWIFMGWREVRKHYQRSIIGPFWLTLNMGILVGGLGVLYSQIFRQEIQHYLPFLGLGLIFWALIGNMINESCTVFSSASAAIKQVQMPLSVHIFQFIWKHIITFLHNVSIYVVLALIFGIWPGLNGLMVFPAIALILLNGFFAALILGPVSARFRDIPPIVASATQVIFFMTPIIWSPSALPDRALFLALNPFYHFMEIARQPLLGELAPVSSWVACIAMTSVLGIVAIVFFSRFRARIAYWA